MIEFDLVVSRKQPHVTEPAEEYFDLEPSKSQQDNSTNSQHTITTIKRSMSRQDTTLRYDKINYNWRLVFNGLVVL